jgi:hypothetical protein
MQKNPTQNRFARPPSVPLIILCTGLFLIYATLISMRVLCRDATEALHFKSDEDGDDGWATGSLGLELAEDFGA